MDNLKMHTPNLADENFKKLAKLFPNAVTETIGEDGEVVRAIDADVLRQEISSAVVEGAQERYQFTWPDKKKSVVLANQPIGKTLRLDREKSVGKDGTPGSIDSENIYIEGDNLDALKLLQETYLGKVKLIYIDPPYNTGSDLIYEDNFSTDAELFLEMDGSIDEYGNHMVQNNDTNGRFHTDWLNMLYPRLRIAKDLLTDNGLIFISIDDKEISNLEKICNEVFGQWNKLACLIWQKKTSSDARMDISAAHDYILVYAKNIPEHGFLLNALPYDETRVSSYTNPDNDPRGPWASVDITGQTGRAPKSQFYEITTPSGKKYLPPEGRCWAMAESTFKSLLEDNRLWFGENGDNRPRQKKFLRESEGQRPWTWWDNKFASYNQASNKELMKLFDGKLVFDNPKPVKLISRIIELAIGKDGNDIVLDFFSGSATTAHAVMEMNSKDGGNRRYICIQIPQELKDSGNNFKANNVALDLGYKNLCDIGEERILRAGQKIKGETQAEIDYGFRVFWVDSTNMEDVYYRPAEYNHGQMNLFASNIKADRTSEDLLFQVLLDLGILLSSDIEQTEIAGKKVFSVAGGYLIACFDDDVIEETVIEIAKRHPFYAVFRDSGMKTDSVMTNFEQIFETYSPKTQRKVL
jgi:type III restriction system methyltransferase